MGADACPVLVGERSWLSVSIEKLTTEAPVNGGRNYDGPKVKPAQLIIFYRNVLALVKLNYMLETPLKVFNTKLFFGLSSRSC
jgi:hypothetical protein